MKTNKEAATKASAPETRTQPDTADVQTALDRSKAYTRKLYAEVQSLTGEGNAPRETFQDIARDLGYDPQDIISAGQDILAQRDELLAALKQWLDGSGTDPVGASRAAIAKAEGGAE